MMAFCRKKKKKKGHNYLEGISPLLINVVTLRMIFNRTFLGEVMSSAVSLNYFIRSKYLMWKLYSCTLHACKLQTILPQNREIQTGQASLKTPASRVTLGSPKALAGYHLTSREVPLNFSIGKNGQYILSHGQYVLPVFFQ